MRSSRRYNDLPGLGIPRASTVADRSIRSRDRATMGEAIADVIRAHVDNLKSSARAWRLHGRPDSGRPRISVKRLRYLLEAFGDATPEAGAATHALGRVQDILGQTHDAKLLCDSVAGVSRGRSPVPRAQVHVLRRVLQSRAQRALRDARRQA